MPTQKDLKKLVRARMQKTGEAYTAARVQLVKKVEPPPNYAEIAGMSDDAVSNQTGRTWSDWVHLLDAAHASDKPHREIATYVSSLGTPDWWSQMITVGYERIRGLRQRGQRRDGGYEATKSRTFAVPLERLYLAFADENIRRQWLDLEITVRSATRGKRMRIIWPDGTSVQIGFLARSETKSTAAIQHEKLPDKATAEAMKKTWSDHFDRLEEWLRR
jgi:uncharacterized protein YndB with AHSA1/START domain